MRILEINQMKIGCVGGMGKINGLMSIGLSTFTIFSSIYFPRPVSVPYGPYSILYGKIRLKTFAHPPFSGVVFSKNLDISLLSPIIIINGKDNLFGSSSDQFYNASLLINFESDIATFPKSIDFSLHPRSLQIDRMDGKSRILLKL